MFVRRKYKFIAIVITILLIFILVYILIETGLKPTIIAMSEAKVEYIAVLAMNNAVRKVLGSDTKYTDLINVLTDADGKTTMVQANTMKITEIASKTSSIAQDEIQVLGEEGIYIPLGALTKSRILSGVGPNIHVKIIPIGSVNIDYVTEFEHAGINQTRHKIYLVMNAQVRVVVPLGSDVVQVSTRVPITETIIVGDVPDYYLNVEDREDMMNLIPGP